MADHDGTPIDLWNSSHGSVLPAASEAEGGSLGCQPASRTGRWSVRARSRRRISLTAPWCWGTEPSHLCPNRSLHVHPILSQPVRGVPQRCRQVGVALPCPGSAWVQVGPSIFKIDGGRDIASSEGSFPSPPANSNLPCSTPGALSSPARGGRVDGNVDGNGSRCRRSNSDLSRRSRAVAEEGDPMAFGPSRPDPTVRRFTPRLAWGIRPLRGRLGSHRQRWVMLFATSPATSPQVRPGSGGPVAVERVGRGERSLPVGSRGHLPQVGLACGSGAKAKVTITRASRRTLPDSTSTWLGPAAARAGCSEAIMAIRI